MPFVRITHAVDSLAASQKSALIAGVQDAVVAVEGEAMRIGVGVVLEESIPSRDLALNCLPFVSVTLVRDALTAAQRAEMATRIVSRLPFSR